MSWALLSTVPACYWSIFEEEQSLASLKPQTWASSSVAAIITSCHIILTWSFWRNDELRAEVRQWQARYLLIFRMTSCQAVTPFSREVFGHICQYCPYMFRPKDFLAQNFFGTKFFFTQNFFGHKFFWDLKFFWTQNFLDATFFWTQYFLDPKFF